MNSAITYDEYHSRKWIPGFDGIRAICALAVLAGHMHTTRWDWLNGNRGVTVFFVLSGFLITMLALKEERSNGALSLSAFYVRRSFRIFPIYYFTLCAYCFLILGLGIRESRADDFGRYVWAYFLYLQEFVVLNPTLPDPFMAHSWTLGIEEKFYLAWPVFCFVLLAKVREQRALCTIGLMLLFGITGLIDQQGIGRYTHHYVFLLIGCLLAELLHRRSTFDRIRWLGETRWVYTTFAILMVANFGWRVFVDHPDPKSYDTILYVIYKYLFGVLTFFFLASIILGRTALHRLLCLAPFVFVGQLSYGVYLIHRLAIGVSEKVLPFKHDTWLQSTCHLLLTSGISIGAAAVLFYTLEKPCISFGRRWSNRIIASQQARTREAVAAGTPAPVASA